MLTAYPPVLHMHGGGVRMFHNIRILAERHSVRVITFVENEAEREALHSLENICESVTPIRRVPDFRPHWLSITPFLVREFSTPEMYRAVEAAFTLKKVDVLQCEYLPMAQYRRRGTFSILTIHETGGPNAYEAFRTESDPIEKLRLFYRWMAVMRYEVLQSRKFDRVVTLTEHDSDHLRSYSPAANIQAIPIGVDDREFAPLPETPGHPVEAVFLGNFRHSPNVTAAEFLVHEVAPRLPDMRFVISGRNLPDDFRGGSNVEIRGFVDDTRPLYRRPNSIVLAPLFTGTGQRVKLLEAFAMSCPVVTSSIGALGYPIRNGVDALIADTTADFVAALRQLSASAEFRREVGRNGREMVLRHFTWDRIGQQLLRLVEERKRNNEG
ncbi:MAG: glycosyltransferase [Acidobacteria bacterium]|nr:glycosyltransferase [Acidobacteriota bacterium]